MKDVNWKVKDGADLSAENVAKIACALKSLAVYTSMACADDESPAELREVVEQGLQTIDEIFEV